MPNYGISFINVEPARIKYIIIRKLFSQKLFLIFFFFKIYNITLDPDPNWTKILYPDPTSMYLDPQHCRVSLATCSHVRCYLPWTFSEDTTSARGDRPSRPTTTPGVPTATRPSRPAAGPSRPAAGPSRVVVAGLPSYNEATGGQSTAGSGPPSYAESQRGSLYVSL